MKPFLSGVLDQTGKRVKGEIPGNLLELGRARLPVERLAEPEGRVQKIDEGGALGAKRAAVHRVIRVALHMNGPGLHISGAVGLGIDEDPA